MKQPKLFLIVTLLLFVTNGCKDTQNKQDESQTSTYMLTPAQDTACRQTIQRLYTIESYCPNNLLTLQQLFTENFNEQHKLTLDRCNEVSNYHIAKLLSPNDDNFPRVSNPTATSDGLVYYAEIEIESKSGMALGNSPSSAWIYMKVDKLGQCKIEMITGGG